MNRVIFSTKYEIMQDKMDIYLDKIAKLKEILSGLGYNYSIFKDKKKNNCFYELLIFNSKEEFENFEDSFNDEANDIIYEINSSLIVNKSISYETLEEV